MTIYDRRMLERIWILLQECGMPDKLPQASLLWDLYFMIEEYQENHGVSFDD